MTAARPRILEVLYSFGLGGSQVLGLETAKQLKQEGAEVLCTALDASPGPLSERCRQYGIPIVDLKIPRKSPLGRNGLSIGLTNRVRALRLDAMHLQHLLGLNKLGLPGRIAGVNRIVVTEHSVFDVSQTVAGRFRIRINWRLASAIAVVHDGIRSYLCNELKVPADLVSVIPVGLDVERFARADRHARRIELGLTDDLAFVFVGRLAPVKNVPALAEAFLSVQSQHSRKARLFVVGDGEDMTSLRAIVAAHPMGDRVQLIGERTDVRPFLSAADVFVLNSSSEGMPLALMEAMATGLAAICPSVGYIPEMLADGGWLTEPGNRPSLERALCAALENPASVELAGRRNQEYVRANFAARVVAARYRRLLGF